MDTLRQDLVFAFRLLGKDRAFALTTILTLALCIGANTAIFSVVRLVLLRPLPYPEADRIVFEYDGFPGAGVERAGTSVPNYFDRRAMTDVLESQALYQFGGFGVGTGPGAEGVAALNVTPSFFQVLRARAVRGRLSPKRTGRSAKTASCCSPTALPPGSLGVSTARSAARSGSTTSPTASWVSFPKALPS